MAHSCIPLVLGPILSQVGTALTSDLPRFRAENGAQQFVVHGKPFSFLEANSEILLREQRPRLTSSGTTWRGCT
jgi:hypothetical protein